MVHGVGVAKDNFRRLKEISGALRNATEFRVDVVKISIKA
jgi:hypothetical protein